ncbi:TolC family protein [Magnetococcus sp. PR-3]|uniref:TolC family protein n=1 Tax=Magnetococcus sp. PR-3 TaxID=3120355 RepID=UPI002FCE1708
MPNKLKNNTKQWLNLAVVSMLGIVVAGCVITPDPVTSRDVRSRVQADQFKIYAAQDPVFAPITFNEALARSLKYNLDLRLKLMEKAHNRGLSEVANFEMLPDLMTSAGYTHRNNVSGSYSYDIDSATGVATDPATPSYTGSEPGDNRNMTAEFTWSALDFGIGYYSSKQAANEVLIAEERRRRVVQNILSDVRSAYWRAVGAQRLARQADQLTVQVRAALERSRTAEAQGLIPPKEALSYQRMLLDAVNLLASRRTELDLAKRELAALMNITPGTDFSVDEVDEPELKPAPLNVAELEEMALRYRPELRQEDYKVRITAAEARKQILSLLPNPSLLFGLEYDSNKYLFNDNWLTAGAKVNWNLFKAFSYKSMQDTQQRQVEVDNVRRMALSMAVLTQVRVAVERYKLTLQELDVANESFLVDQRMSAFAHAARGSQMNAKLEAIRAKTRALNSEFKRYSAYAAAQSAFGRIFNSVGFEVIPPKLDKKLTLEDLGAVIVQHINRVEKNNFAHASVLPAKLPTFSVHIEGVDAPLNGQIMDSVQSIFDRNRMPSKADAKHQLRMTMNLDGIQKGVRPASWLLSVYNDKGEKVGEKRYASTLTANPSNRTLLTFAESAIIANVGMVRGLLQTHAGE